jgi:ubiquinone/menaquinone biosynthesis C-methylase UbiE
MAVDQNLFKTRLEELISNTGDMALKRRARMIIEAISPKKNEKILDIGCGDGYYLHLLSNLRIPLALSGTDYDEVGLSKARKNLGKKIPLYTGDLMKKLPFRSGTFHKAVMSEVCEHLPNDTKGLKEVNRIMKKGGTLVITVPCHDYPLFWDPINWVLEKLFDTHIKSGFFAGLWNQHERLYTTKQIKKVVQTAGFEIIECRALTWWCLPFNHYIVNIVARLLAHGNLNEKTKSSLSKFTKSPRRPLLLNLAFSVVNKIDNLNDLWCPKDHGVGVFVKAKKI